MADKRRYRGKVNRPGVQFPDVGASKPIPFMITAEFLERLNAKGFNGVPVNIQHGPRTGASVVGVVLGHGMDGPNLMADYELDPSKPKGDVSIRAVETGIALGKPIQVSFEVEELVFAEDPEKAMLAGRPVVPVDGVVKAVSLVEVGACGQDCAIDALAAQKAGGTEPCCSGCKDGDGCEGEALKWTRFALPFEAAQMPDPPADKPAPEDFKVKFEASQKELEAAKAAEKKLQDELAALRKAQAKKDGEAKDADESEEDEPAKGKPAVAPVDKEARDRLAKAEKDLADMKQRDTDAERQAAIDSIKELAPEIKVDEKAPMEVLQAQLATVAAFRKKDPKMVMRAHRYGGAKSATLDEGDVGKPTDKNALAKAAFAERLSAPGEKRLTRLPKALDEALGSKTRLFGATYASIAGLDPDLVSRFVLEGIYEARILSPAIAATVIDKRGETGDVVRIPILGTRTAQGPVAVGGSLAAADTPISNVAVTIQKFGDEERIPTEVLEDQQSFTIADFLRAQTEALAEKIDLLVYAALIASTTTNTAALAVAGTLTDLYEKIVDVKAAMRKAKRPATHIIMGADQEAALLKLTNEGIKDRAIILTANGEGVATVAGIPVIVTANANANAVTLSLVQVVLIHKPRAVGEAWGRMPDSTVDELTLKSSDQVKLVSWLRYGTAVLEHASVGLVKNPAA